MFSFFSFFFVSSTLSDVTHEMDCRTAWLGCPPPPGTADHVPRYSVREGFCISSQLFSSSSSESQSVHSGQLLVGCGCSTPASTMRCLQALSLSNMPDQVYKKGGGKIIKNQQQIPTVSYLAPRESSSSPVPFFFFLLHYFCVFCFF